MMLGGFHSVPPHDASLVLGCLCFAPGPGSQKGLYVVFPCDIPLLSWRNLDVKIVLLCPWASLLQMGFASDGVTCVSVFSLCCFCITMQLWCWVDFFLMCSGYLFWCVFSVSCANVKMQLWCWEDYYSHHDATLILVVLLSPLASLVLRRLFVLVVFVCHDATLMLGVFCLAWSQSQEGTNLPCGPWPSPVPGFCLQVCLKGQWIIIVLMHQQFKASSH